jgi:hypothetical protein
MVVSGNSQRMASAVSERACCDLAMEVWDAVLERPAAQQHGGVNEIVALLNVLSHVRRVEDLPAITRILEQISASATGCLAFALYGPFMDFALNVADGNGDTFHFT